MNYFELYEMPMTIHLDKNDIKKKYYQLSKKYHPDFHDEKSDISASENLLLSSKVNEGYALFQNEFATLGYALRLKNVITPDEKYTLPSDFLMEMMELNEDLNEQSNSVIENRKQELQQPLAHLFALDLNTVEQNELDILKEYYYKMKYLNRLQQRINGVEEFD